MAGGITLAWVRSLICITFSLGVQQGSIIGVEGHAYMMAPISRTYWYTPIFQES